VPFPAHDRAHQVCSPPYLSRWERPQARMIHRLFGYVNWENATKDKFTDDNIAFFE
jgi:hypothetical protein